MGSENPKERRSSDDDRQRAGGSGGIDRGADPAEGSTGEPGEQSRGGPARTRPVSVDDLFELLARPGNRYLLAYLSRADEPVGFEEVVESVVDGADPPAGLSTAEFRDRVATRLVHSNLPKLDAAGLIDYDREARAVRTTDATAVALPYLELAMDQFSPE